MKLSIVSPVYKAENLVDELIRRIQLSAETISQDYEIILVEDGGPDKSWEKIEGHCKRDSRIRGIKLSRNFGQHYAISAGLEHCQGDWIVVMDCDLQDKPEEIIKLYNKALEGYEIVLGRRHERKDNFFKRLSSRLFYSLFSYLTETKQDYYIANFGIYHKSVIQAMLQMGDYFRVFPILVQWVGFTRTQINIDHDYRQSGKSGYSFSKLIRLAFDMIISFSEKPLRLGLKFGISVSILSFIIGIWYLILYLSGKIGVPGFTSLIISIAFSTGIIISFLGFIGVYLGKISMQVKNRPKYIIKTKIN